MRCTLRQAGAFQTCRAWIALPFPEAPLLLFLIEESGYTDPKGKFLRYLWRVPQSSVCRGD